jgi:hypothetical protein
MVCRLWSRFAGAYYGEVCLLGDFNRDLLDPGHSLFPRFLDFWDMFMLCNVAVFFGSVKIN